MTAPARYAVAVVGSGPSGFYLAEALFRSGAGVEVDMFERLLTPFGLVRFGVAAEHPKLKQVTVAFERIAATPGFRFLGGVEVGRDVTVDALRDAYDAVVLATGAELDRRLGVPGEDLTGVHVAADFVAWCNGHPDFAEQTFDLDAEAAVVVGHGNVALDVARILVQPLDVLRRTDMPARVLERLAESRIREIHIVGRGRAADAKFGAKELSEFADLAGCDSLVDPRDLDLDAILLRNAEAREKAALLQEFSLRRPARGKSCMFRFGLSPLAIEGRGRVEGIAFRRTSSGRAESLGCGLVLSSVGRRTARLPGVPYDETHGVHANWEGCVATDDGFNKGLYACGWSKRGATGTIGTNRACALATAGMIVADLQGVARPGRDRGQLIERLDAGERRPVRFADWKALDAAEIRGGVALGKPREKFVDLARMREVIAAAQMSRLDCAPKLNSPAMRLENP